ncbi:MAG: DNA translocase FtsK [Paramuribaculum sp.]|nr:DNA translocase FtsK [Paramuribaculum sp.]
MPNSGYTIPPKPTPENANNDTPEQPVAPQQASTPVQQSEPSTPAPKKETVKNTTNTKQQRSAKQIKSVDNTGIRISTFIGIVIFIIAGYLLVAAIGFLSAGSADQSVIENRNLAEIAQSANAVQNTAGKFGAYFSNFVISKWIGLSAFILIYYLGVIGLLLIRFTHIRVKFWQFTFKTFAAAIALSIILGALTYNSESPVFWGGLHGFLVIQFFYDYTGVWGCIGLCIIMASALILIFIKPIAKIYSTISTWGKRITNKIHARYQASMRAGNYSTALDTQNPEPTTNTVSKTNSTDPEPSIKEETPSEQISTDIEEPAFDVHLTDIAAVTNIAVTTATATDTIPDPTVTTEPVDALSFDVTPYPITNSTTDSIEKSSYKDTVEPQQVSTPVTIPETPAPAVITQPKEPITIQSESKCETLIIDQPQIEQADKIEMDVYDPTADLSRYHLPSISLLREYPDKGAVIDEAEQEENKQVIINTLRTYGVEISSIKATVGPTITLYEIVPAEGVRIATIKRLSDDMTLSLSAIGIRIIAPIPGKGTIGMEVPNKKKQIVSIRDVLSSRAFQESTDELPLAMGTTISNEVFITDLAKMPHLLVAGATGMGKSVGLNTIIASLLYKKHPAELKMVLIDPKMVEFSLYKCIEKHFLAKLPEEENAIITDPNKVVATLNSLCIEMDNRYKLLSDAGLRGIKDYNKKFILRHLNPNKGHRYLPYIVVIIDEFADLIITAGKEVEAPISRIAAKARAVGIHMILATQRPSVNVITGVIKANFPGRMAFRVTQMNDSRTIIDRPGAEQLVGKGDMLISRDGVIDRVQCAFIDTDEVERMTQAIADQMGYPTAYELPECLPAESGTGGGAIHTGERDALYAEAGRAVIDSQTGSTSFLQRKFNIGYPRAGKIMDQLEAAGVIGPASGMKPRAILMDMYAFEQSLNQ